MDLAPSTFVKIEGTQISVTATGVAEAKMALKELKLKKKEFATQKRLIAGRLKEIRATYTAEVRTRGSMARGGGGFGRFVRAVQSISRDGKRSQLASDLAPLERAMQDVDAMIYTIDRIILQIEAKLLKHEA